MARVVAKHVSKQYHSVQGQTVDAIADISFSVEEGECVCIVGETGCGKSTLLSILLGLERPTNGELTIGGVSPSQQFQAFRGRLACVFQTDRLLPWRSAIDNARVGLEVLGYGKSEQLHRAAEWLEKVGLKGYEGAFPHELSGGMRQRVAIARAFAVNPEVLLLDEAFGHLDEATAGRMRADFLDLLAVARKTCIIVTHGIEEAIELATRILVLSKPAQVVREYALSERDKREPGRVQAIRREIVGLIERPV